MASVADPLDPELDRQVASTALEKGAVHGVWMVGRFDGVGSGAQRLRGDLPAEQAHLVIGARVGSGGRENVATSGVQAQYVVERAEVHGAGV